MASKPSTPKYEDCTPCRAVGSATFLGLGAFTFISGRNQIKANAAAIRASGSMFGVGSRMAGITATSIAMVGAGIYRWFAGAKLGS